MSTYRMIKSALRIAAGLVLVFTLSIPKSAVHAITYTVINTNDSGAGSLRQAIINASINAGSDSIMFNIPLSDPGYQVATGVFTIALTSGVLEISDNYTYVYGWSQKDNQGNTNINGLEIMVSSSSTLNPVFSITSDYNAIESLCITHGLMGVELASGSDFNNIAYNIIGLDADRSAKAGNTTGVGINLSDSNTLLLNYIAGNTLAGVEIIDSNDNVITNNFIGTNGGFTNLGNSSDGVAIWGSSTGNMIGGEDSSDYNVISSNGQNGVLIALGPSGNTISHNYIGTDNTGEYDLGNSANGIYVTDGSPGNEILFNVISGNQNHGVKISGAGTDSNEINHNTIGANAAGISAIGNEWHGVELSGGSENSILIGNIICANKWSGMVILNSTGNYAGGNKIGIGSEPTKVALGNTYYGIHILGSNNTIHDDEIAYNGSDGIRTDGGSYSSLNNSYLRTSIHGNDGKGIENINGGNYDRVGPILDASSTCTYVTGSAPVPGARIFIYTGFDNEGRIYVDNLFADGTGHFKWHGYLSGTFISALWADGMGANTSEFSSMPTPPCNILNLPMIIRP